MSNNSYLNFTISEFANVNRVYNVWPWLFLLYLIIEMLVICIWCSLHSPIFTPFPIYVAYRIDNFHYFLGSDVIACMVSIIHFSYIFNLIVSNCRLYVSLCMLILFSYLVRCVWILMQTKHTFPFSALYCFTKAFLRYHEIVLIS